MYNIGIALSPFQPYPSCLFSSLQFISKSNRVNSLSPPLFQVLQNPNRNSRSISPGQNTLPHTPNSTCVERIPKL
ncbi:hypothetical protein NC653_027978 [Populus alba x Populus x berolinensis]|uniref:Uncharacterized protein n=1 Tax=Populus alba x Populus x berolinensis TaxID=444605 RepID=A0AAD6M786_9ROSI|nr:hypothetical protein NC653_027978 [Populus alba x Populus x berolinensis]